MQGCKGKGTPPITKAGPEKSMEGEPLDPERASKARIGIDLFTYYAQDRPDLRVTARVLFQRVANPNEGIGRCLKRAIRHLASHLRGVLMYPRGSAGHTVKRLTDSDWAGDVSARKSCSGGYI